MNYAPTTNTMSEADQKAVKDALALIREKMPFLISLPKKKRMSLPKLGPKSMKFVQDSYMTTTNFPQAFPSLFNIDKFQKDVEFYMVLHELKMLADTIHEKIDSTHMAVGHEVMNSSLSVFKYVKNSNSSHQGLIEMVERLKARFKRKSKAKISDPTVPVDPTE